MHLKMNGGSKKKDNREANEQHDQKRKGFQASLRQEAVVKICFEDQVEGNEITR